MIKDEEIITILRRIERKLDELKEGKKDFTILDNPIDEDTPIVFDSSVYGFSEQRKW